MTSSKDPSLLQAILASKRIPKSFLEHFLSSCQTDAKLTQSLVLLGEAGYLDAKEVDENGHHLLMRMLMTGSQFKEENLKLLVKYFPISEKDKLLLSEEWIKKLTINPDEIKFFNMMRILEIPLVPKESWHQVFLQTLTNSRREITQRFIDAGMEINWSKMGTHLSLKAWKENGAILEELEKFLPDLSEDENWKNCCNAYLSQMDFYKVSLLMKCGVQPDVSTTTKGMTSDQIISWIQKEPKNILEFAKIIAAKNEFDPTSDEAKFGLGYLFFRIIKERERVGGDLHKAVELLVKRGVEYDPTLIDTLLKQNNLKSFNVLLKACELNPELKQSQSLKSHLETEFRIGNLTIENLKILYNNNISIDYKLIPEDKLVELTFLLGSKFLITLRETDVKISNQFATKLFSRILESGSEYWELSLLQHLEEYQIDNKEFILNQACIALYKKMPKHFQEKMILLMKLGASWNQKIEDELIYSPSPEALMTYIQIDFLAADHPILAKLSSYTLEKLERIRYEKGVKPSSEECLTRYWRDVDYGLNDLIYRDLHPDPKSEIAMTTLYNAVMYKNWKLVERLQKLNVPLQFTDIILEHLRSLLEEFLLFFPEELFDTFLALGWNPTSMRDDINKKATDILSDPEGSLAEIIRIARLMSLTRPVLPNPSAVIANALKNIYYDKELKLMSELGYDFSIHEEEIINRLKDPDCSIERKITLIAIYPRVVQSDLISHWFIEGPPSIFLLQEIEAAGGDDKVLRDYINSNLPALLDIIQNSNQLNFIERYVDSDRWKQRRLHRNVKEIIE